MMEWGLLRIASLAAVLILCCLTRSALPSSYECNDWYNTTVDHGTTSTVESCVTSSEIESGTVLQYSAAFLSPSLSLPLSPTLFSLFTIAFIEFIISFNGYYSEETRDSYISAALHSSNTCSQWRTIPRSNPSQKFPSDFTILHLPSSTANRSHCIRLLSNHPAVKTVTPHRKFSRSLSCAGGVGGRPKRREVLGDAGERWVVGRRLLRAVPRQITSALHANVLWTLGHSGKGIKVRESDHSLTRCGRCYDNVFNS